MAKYTFLNMCEEVIHRSGTPLTFQEAWESAVKLGLDKRLGSKGQTPWSTLNANLIVDCRDNPASRFVREPGRPAKFRLKDPAASAMRVASAWAGEAVAPEPPDEAVAALLPTADRPSRLPYRERQLHPFVARFAHYAFRGAYCRTIYHEGSAKRGYAEWLHPDMVGFWFPFGDYDKELLALSGDGLAIARFYSFELKRELSLSNLRESFFQAVSNSSWAHEGYLAAANIDASEELRGELARLSGSFGIGVVELDLAEPQKSQVLFPAESRPSIDWDGANKLARTNDDFRSFLRDARIDIAHAKPHASEFDKVETLEGLAALREAWGSAA